MSERNLRSTDKVGVQRAAALCRGFGGVPRKSFFSFFAAAGGVLSVDVRKKQLDISDSTCEKSITKIARRY
jgi:hypothetical protein